MDERFKKQRNDSATEIDRVLRRIFAAYDRLAPVLVRYLRKGLGVQASIELQSVERCPLPLPFPTRRRYSLFKMTPVPESLPVYLETETPFLLAAIDRILGNETFRPDYDVQNLTASDRNLAERLMNGMTDLFSQIGGFPNAPLVFLSGPQGSESEGNGPNAPGISEAIYFVLLWEIEIDSSFFPLTLYLPEEWGESLFTESELSTDGEGEKSSLLEPSSVPLPEFHLQGNIQKKDGGLFREKAKRVEISPADLAQLAEDRRKNRSEKESGSIPLDSEEEGARERRPDAVLPPDGLPGRESLTDAHFELPAEIRVLAGSLTITPEELADMRSGDIILTDIPADTPFIVRVGNLDLFTARPGEFQGKIAVELLRNLTESPEESGNG